MANFLIAHARSSRIEGGYQCMHDDNGNWTGGKVGVGDLVGTNWGISAPVLAAYLKRTPTVADMKNLKEEVAREIFRKNYWNQMKGDQINSQDIANGIYDMGINSGIETAIILQQRELGLHETGVMDRITLDKLNLKS